MNMLLLTVCIYNGRTSWSKKIELKNTSHQKDKEHFYSVQKRQANMFCFVNRLSSEQCSSTHIHNQVKLFTDSTIQYNYSSAVHLASWG